MSNTENKTESSAQTDTAPYMKKDKATDSKPANKKSNFVIPLILVVVSAIVIAATFYQNKYNEIMAQSDKVTDGTQTETEVSVSQLEIITDEPAATAEINTKTTAVSNASPAEQTAATKQPVAPEYAAADVTPASNTVAANAAANSNDASELVQRSAMTASTQPVQAQTAQAQTFQAQTAQAQPGANDTNRYNAYHRKQAKAKAQEHMTMLQQRRQAYEEEMKARRTQYEAAMKAEQERRNHIIEAQKAAYQRAQKLRAETGEKLQSIYKKIDELHKEIDQIMGEYYATQRATTSAPMHTL